MHIWTEGLGLILRGFCQDPVGVPQRAELLIKAAQHAAALLSNGEPVYRRIIIAVPTSTRYPDHDCGWLAPILRELGLPDRTEVLSVDADMCGALNQSVRQLYYVGCKYAHVVASSALDYVNEAELLQADRAISAGAKVYGLAFDEFEPLILEGFVLNSWAIWNILELQAYGGFGPGAALLPDSDNSHDHNGEPSSCEEVHMLCKLVTYHGPCIAVARAQPTGSWDQMPSAALHRERMKIKWLRITEQAQLAGHTPDFVTAGVMHF